MLGWLRIKVLAVELGPGGLGVYGQLWSIVLYGGTVGALGFGVGTTSLIAEQRERGDAKGLRDATATSLSVPWLCSVGVAVAIGTSSPWIAKAALSSHQWWLLAIAAISIPYAALQLPLQHIIQGFEDARGQTIAYAIYAIGFTGASALGAFLGGLTGAAVGLLFGNVLLVHVYLRRSKGLLATARSTLGRWLAPKRRRPFQRQLLRTGGASLAISVVFAAADFGLRSAVLHADGKDTAGIWFALLTISVQFLGVTVGALSYLSAPLFARLNARRDVDATATLVDDTLRITLVTAIPVICGLAALRNVVVPLVFTSKFDPLVHYFPYQMVGDAFRTIAWSLGVALVPLAMTDAWLAIGVGSSIIYAAGIPLVIRFGVGAAVGAWIAMWCSSALITAIVLLRRGFWRPSAQTWCGLILGGCGLTVTAWRPGVVGVIAVLATLGLMFASVAKPTERAAIGVAVANAIAAARRG